MNQPPCILVVDDDPHILYATSRILRDAGYSVIEASSGDECLRLAREHAPDVITLDVVMDEPSGVETCQRLKADPALARSLVLLFSGIKTDSESQAYGLECGADGYITRPISNRELIARVQAMLRLKAAEDELRTAKEFWENLIAALPDGFSVLNPDGVHIQVNAALCQMTGFSREELIGAGIPHPYWPPEEYATIEQAFQRILHGDLADLELTFMRKDGTRFPALVSLACLKDQHDNVLNYFATIKDITERKRIEQTLREYSQHLEQMVAERTRELRAAQEQLLRQERLTMLGQIAGGIGHELRNPLSAINNAAYLLRETLPAPNDEVRQALDILIHQVQVSNRIIHSLLAFARPHPPTRRPTDIAALCHVVLAQATFPEHINVQCKMVEELIVNADADQLQIVFSNLIRNAVEAMPHGGTLTIEARLIQPSGVEIAFSDTGVGIPADVRDKIFQPMFTTRKHGLGLGLPLCKLIVEAHGGTISVTSQEGKGTTFTIMLPVNHLQPSEARQ